ncbi:GAF domain-containing protein [Shewanella sp. Scap07]|uniref:sigma 54-interacting transcriptional regulator n=1 Tax=Shewanella sp. Scap07 TaxID=2589987 RepID=UPI0015B9D40C|nr:sigma 54-interacting transcriptional regulator [Shewanella sp. Scap07]QLE87447.1 GAF domain-containing protein [Shewanella sp. Scap07]
MLKMTPLIDEISTKWEPIFIDVAQDILLATDVRQLVSIVNKYHFRFVNISGIHVVLRSFNEENSNYYSEYNYVNCEVSTYKNYQYLDFDEQPGLAIMSYEQFEYHHPTLVKEVKYLNFSSYCRMPLKVNERIVGWVEFQSRQVDEFNSLTVSKLRQLANIITIGIGNVLNKEKSKTKEKQLREEKKSCEVLVDITNAVLRQESLKGLAITLQDHMRKHFNIEHLSLMSIDHEQKELICHDVYKMKKVEFLGDNSDPGGTEINVRLIKIFETPAEIVFKTKKPLLICKEQLQSYQLKYKFCEHIISHDLQSACVIPLVFRGEIWGALKFCHSDKDYFKQCDLDLLLQVGARAAMGLNHFHLNAEFAQAAQLNEPVADDIGNQSEFSEIVYQSQAMEEVLAKVKMVAPSDCTVLILGETGTGKELIATAVHQLSARKGKPMVKMNCASVPSGLFESDLFGHEKGAFTGALTQRIGRFEMANKGTFFLDEVGDMPLDLQPKLLRVLQEGEFERVGKHQLIPVDVRLIAATNCDLLEMVKNKEFRSDLYYRLNVFPIVLPPLRERREDIGLLAKHFVQEVAAKMGKNITSIPSETLRLLALLPWYGNIRELRNVIERAVITTQGKTLVIPTNELKALLPSGQEQVLRAQSVSETDKLHCAEQDEQDLEREQIIAILKETNGIVAGPKGAAVKLGLKRTTLLSRMQRLGISSRSYSS